jgi:hypothetical protein
MLTCCLLTFVIMIIIQERNSHHVPANVIEMRHRQLTPLIPFYFGLFLNEEQSNSILTYANDFYQQALRMLPQLKHDLEEMSEEKSIDIENISKNDGLIEINMFLLNM